MDITAYNNLISNYGYEGTIGIYTGPDKGSLKKDGIYLVKYLSIDTSSEWKQRESIQYNKKYRTLELPNSEEEILESKEKYGKTRLTSMTCTFVPDKFVKLLKL